MTAYWNYKVYGTHCGHISHVVLCENNHADTSSCFSPGNPPLCLELQYYLHDLGFIEVSTFFGRAFAKMWSYCIYLNYESATSTLKGSPGGRDSCPRLHAHFHGKQLII